ncbi:MAG: VOC family protein [Actinomycetota bacterium]
MGAPVVWFEVGGDDADRLEEFYGGLFDWKTTKDDMDYRFVDTGGEAGIPGGIYASPSEVGSYVTFYGAVDDIAASVTVAVELGGSLVQPPTPLPNGAMVAMVDDPEGHRVGLIQQTA